MTGRVMSAVLLVAVGLLLGAGAMAPVHAGLAIGVTIEKLVNGEIADAAPGPVVPVGSTVTFTYQITSAFFIPFDIAIVGIVVEDDNGTVDTADDFNPTFTGGDAGILGRLENGETWTYSATRAALLGDHENIATVNGSFTLLSNGAGTFPLSPEFDSGHYRGVAPAGVPEPTALALLGAGVVALGYFRRGRP